MLDPSRDSPAVERNRSRRVTSPEDDDHFDLASQINERF